MDIREAEIAQVEIEIMDKARISNNINFQNPDQLAQREDQLQLNDSYSNIKRKCDSVKGAIESQERKFLHKDNNLNAKLANFRERKAELLRYMKVQQTENGDKSR